MSDVLVKRNRIQMKELCAIRSAPAIECLYRMSYLCSILQALFACEEFRIRVILIANQFPNNESLKIHAIVSYLFEHMIVGKEAYLICDGIIELITSRLPKIEYHLEINPKIFLRNFLQILYDNYDQYKRMQPYYSCPAELFLTQFRVDCKKCGQSKSAKNKWLTRLNVSEHVAQQQPISIQRQIDLFIENRCYMYGKSYRCHRCREAVMIDYVWTKPSILVIELSPRESNTVHIEDTLTVESYEYTLIASIMCEPNEKGYSAVTKVAKMWYYFKNKFVQEMPIVKRLHNVCLLFYKKMRSLEVAKTIAEYDTVNVMPHLKLTQQPVNLLKFRQHTDTKLRCYPSADTRELTIELARTQAFENTEGICYMNATLHALYHCVLFRTYIMDCDVRLGQFHRHLKKLFIHMYNRNAEKGRKWHQKLYNLEMKINFYAKSGSVLEFYDQLLSDLHKEIIEFEARHGTDYSQQFSTKVKDKNYANVGIDREDLASSNAWIQYLSEEHNTAIVNLFTVQQITFERCRVGHKNQLMFDHKFNCIVPAEISTDKSLYTSLQDIVNGYMSSVMVKQKQCSRCQVFKELFHFNNGISRVSNILVFKFNLSVWDETTREFQYVKINLDINKCLTIFADIYHCMAYIVDYNTEREKHVYTVAQDDNKWWQFNDKFVQLIGAGMPPVDSFLDCENIFMVFYEKKVNISEIRLRRFEDTHLHIWQLQLSTDSSQKQLTLEAAIVGLYNLYGVTSYMHCVIQCLYHCTQFRKYIIYDQKSNGDSRQTHSLLRWLFVNISMTDLSGIDTQDFWKHFTVNHKKFAKKREHNAKAFYQCIIDELLKQRDIEDCAILDIDLTLYYARDSGVSLPDKYFGDTNFSILNMFAILYEVKITCESDAQHNIVSYIPEYILHLETECEENIQSLISDQCMKPNSSEVRCEVCQSNASQVSTICRAPNILVIELTKLSYNEQIGKRTATILQNIRIDEYIEVCDQMYLFRACICCDNPTFNSIHYTAYVKCNKMLYCLKDMNAQTANKAMHELEYVYIVFYEKL